jgi:hypothetical protein
MALGSTHPLKEMSTMIISLGQRCIRLTTLTPSCAVCLEIWEPQLPGTFQGLSRPVIRLLYLHILTEDLCPLRIIICNIVSARACACVCMRVRARVVRALCGVCVCVRAWCAVCVCAWCARSCV